MWKKVVRDLLGIERNEQKSAFLKETHLYTLNQGISNIFKQNSNFLIKVQIIVKLLCNKHNEVGCGLDAFCFFSTFNRMPILNYVFTESAV